MDKNIFQSWYTKDLHPKIQEKIDIMKSMNPDYTYHLYTDEDMDNFVKETYPLVYPYYNQLNIIVAKVDFWRYLVLYRYGGIYLDMDSSINGKIPFTDTTITAEKNPNMYVQWALVYAKGHPILKRTIELIVENIKYKRYNEIHKMTGLTVYSQAIREIHFELFNEPLKHSMIDYLTDKIYKKDDVSYRVYGRDYNGLFTFKHEIANLLYINKKTWREEEREKQLLKN